MSGSKPFIRPSFLFGLLALAAAILVAGIVVLPRPDSEGQGQDQRLTKAETHGPKAQWLFGPDQTASEAFAQVPSFDPVTLTLDLPAPAHVYVVSFDLTQGALSFFPSDYLSTNLKNPLAAGRHVLPGQWKGKQMEWYVPEVTGAVSFLVVVSQNPIADLQKAMASLRQMGNTAFPDRSMGLYMPKRDKGQPKPKLPSRSKPPHPLLQTTLYEVEATEPGVMLPHKQQPGVWLHAAHIQPTKPRQGAKNPGNPFQQKLQKMVDEKLQSSKAK